MVHLLFNSTMKYRVLKWKLLLNKLLLGDLPVRYFEKQPHLLIRRMLYVTYSFAKVTKRNERTTPYLNADTNKHTTCMNYSVLYADTQSNALTHSTRIH